MTMRSTGWSCVLGQGGELPHSHQLSGFIAWYQDANGRFLIHRLAGPDPLLDGQLPFDCDALSVALSTQRGQPPLHFWPRARLVRTARQLGRIEEFEIVPQD